jgi:hypothetical protein
MEKYVNFKIKKKINSFFEKKKKIVFVNVETDPRLWYSLWSPLREQVRTH